MRNSSYENMFDWDSTDRVKTRIILTEWMDEGRANGSLQSKQFPSRKTGQMDTIYSMTVHDKMPGRDEGVVIRFSVKPCDKVTSRQLKPWIKGLDGKLTEQAKKDAKQIEAKDYISYVNWIRVGWDHEANVTNWFRETFGIRAKNSDYEII